TAVSQRSVLSAQGFSNYRPSLARSPGRYPLVGSTLCSEVRPTDEEAHRDDPVGGHEGPPIVSLARQCTGAGKFHRASGDSYSGVGSVGVTCRIKAVA